MSRKIYKLVEERMKELVPGDMFAIFDDNEYVGVFEAVGEPYPNEDEIWVIKCDTVDVRDIGITIDVPEDDEDEGTELVIDMEDMEL